METVVIVIHLMIVVALVGVVLLQRSEGGGLGIGGGSGFMTARGAANALTRTTAILAAAFFISSLALSVLARYYTERPTDILDRLPAQTEQGAPANRGVLDQLGGSSTTTPATGESQPAAPTGEAPAPAAPAQETAPAQPAAPAVPNN
ncbi:MAG: preprotein translocase subunit SecG [Rhizobiaceae bacterium]|nr:preprotein translocase subunit SecG [Rhizobiaceae bacterium]